MRRNAPLAIIGILTLLALAPGAWGQFVSSGGGFLERSPSITGITSDSSGVTGITFSGSGPHLNAPSGQPLVHTGTRDSGATGADHVLDTANVRTTGNLLELRNQGSSKLSVRYDGAVVGALGDVLLLHLRVTAVCQEKDEQGAVVRAEPCDVDKPARWWVDNGLMSQGQITSLHAIWDHTAQPANVGKAVPRKRRDGTEVLEDLR